MKSLLIFLLTAMCLHAQALETKILEIGLTHQGGLLTSRVVTTPRIIVEKITELGKENW